MRKMAKFSSTSNECNRIWVRYECSLYYLFKTAFSVMSTFTFLKGIFEMLFLKISAYFGTGFTFLFISFRTFRKTDIHLPKLIGWFLGIARYRKPNLIIAAVFGTPRYPTWGEMPNVFSSNNSINIKLARQDHYNN